MNIVALMGRLTDEPNTRATSNGNMYSKFTLAVKRSVKDANGEYPTDFISCTAWGKTAEFVQKYCHKGKLYGVNGTLQTSSYKDKETGKNRTSWTVVVNNVYFGEDKKSEDGRASDQPTRAETFRPISLDGDLPF